MNIPQKQGSVEGLEHDFLESQEISEKRGANDAKTWTPHKRVPGFSYACV
jgi:hypothetical protein